MIAVPAAIVALVGLLCMALLRAALHGGTWTPFLFGNRQEHPASGRASARSFAAPGADLLPHHFQKRLGRPGEHLVLLPDQIHAGSYLVRQRAEAEAAFSPGMDEPVQAERVTDALLHHQGGVVKQVVGADDVQPLQVTAEPRPEAVLYGTCGVPKKKPNRNPA